MNLIKDFLKGILIGVANIIPGVSGGTMAVSMGVYDQLISAITGIVKNFKRSMRILLPILLGAVAGIGGLLLYHQVHAGKLSDADEYTFYRPDPGRPSRFILSC